MSHPRDRVIREVNKLWTCLGCRNGWAGVQPSACEKRFDLRDILIYTSPLCRGGAGFYLKLHEAYCMYEMKTQTKILTAFRLQPALKKRLARFAKRKNATNTAVVEALIHRHCVTPKEEKL